MNEQKKSIFSNHEIMCRALKDSFIKLNPRTQIKNPVMFMVFVSAILTFVMFLFFSGRYQGRCAGLYTGHIRHPLVYGFIR